MGIRPLGGLSYTKGLIFRRHDAAEYKQKEELEFCCPPISIAIFVFNVKYLSNSST